MKRETHDDDGVMMLGNSGIAEMARRGLDGSEPPIFALQWIYNLACMAEVIWLRELLEASPDEAPKRGAR